MEEKFCRSRFYACQKEAKVSTKFSPWISAASKFLPEFRWGMIKVNEKGIIKNTTKVS